MMLITPNITKITFSPPNIMLLGAVPGVRSLALRCRDLRFSIQTLGGARTLVLEKYDFRCVYCERSHFDFYDF